MVSSISNLVDRTRGDIAPDGRGYIVDARMAAVGATLTFVATASPALATSGLPDIANVLMIGSIGVALVVLTAFDLATFRLPNALTLPLLVAGLLASILQPPHLLDRAFGAAVGYGLLWSVATGYRWVRGHAGLGLGDAKLMAAAGAWLGVEAVPMLLLLSSALALGGALFIQMCGAKLSAQTRLAFGPFLASSFWLMLLYGNRLG